MFLNLESNNLESYIKKIEITTHEKKIDELFDHT